MVPGAGLEPALAASVIPPLDKTRSQVVAPAIAANQFIRFRLAALLLPERRCGLSLFPRQMQEQATLAQADEAALYELLSNPIYIGEIRHKGVHHPGLHEPILDRELWDATQLMLRSEVVRRVSRARKSAPSPLTGKLFDESGQSLTPSHAVKDERRYRYYVSRNLIKGPPDSTGRSWRLPAPEIESTVASAAYTILIDQAAIAEASHLSVSPRVGSRRSSV